MASLIRKAGRGRNSTSQRTSYRKSLWFRPRLERLEDRTLLSAPGDVLSAFNNGAGALAGQNLSYAIVNQALGNLQIPLATQSLANSLVGVSTDLQTPFSSNLSGTTWSAVQSQLQNAGFTIDDSPVVNSDGSWSQNADGNFFEVTWTKTWAPPAILIAGNTGFSYLDANGGVFGAISATANVTFKVTMGVDNTGFFLLASNAGSSSVPGTTLSAALSAGTGSSLTGTLNLPGGIGSVTATATPKLNLSAGANFNTTTNDSDGKIRATDLQNALPTVVSGSLSPNSSAELDVNLDASFLDTDLKWTATGSYNLNSSDTGWSDGSFNFNFPDPKTLLGGIGGNFFKYIDAFPVNLGPLSSALNQQIPLINKSIAQLTGLDNALPQLPTEPSDFSDNPVTTIQLGGNLGAITINVTPQAIQALLDPQSGQAPVNLVSWTTGQKTVPLINTSYSVPLYAVGIPGLADGEIDANFSADASLDYNLGFGIDTHGMYFQTGTPSNPNLGLTVALSAGITGSVKLAGFPIAQAGGSVGINITPYVSLTAPNWPNHPTDRVYLSDLEAFGSNPISDILDDLSAGIQGDLTGTISAQVNLGFYKKHKSTGVTMHVFNFHTNPSWPPPPPPATNGGSSGGASGTGAPSIWSTTVSMKPGGVLQFEDTRSNNNGDSVILSQTAPGNVTIQWAGAGSQTYSGVSQFNFIADNPSGNNLVVATPGFNIPILANDSASKGNDLLEGGAGQDTLIGGSGNDTLIAGSGNDLIDGGSGNTFNIQSLSGNKGNDSIIGGAGNDTLWANFGNDYIQAGSGTTTIHGGASNGLNTLIAGSGNDVIDAGTGTGNDSIVGGPGSDIIQANAGSDHIQAGSGPTSIYGGGGVNTTDTLLAGSGNDYISGNRMDGTITTCNFVIVGGPGLDTLIANGGSDTIHGGSGNSTIYGGYGVDSIYAGSGNDSIVGGSGTYYIDGGSGNDTILAGSGENDTIHGGSGSDHIDAGSSFGSDLIYGGDAGHNLIYGSRGGNDTIYGGGPNDTIYGGAGGFDIIHGGTAADHSTNTNNQIYGAGFSNEIYGSGGGDQLYAGTPGSSTLCGNSTIYGGSGAETLYGGDGQDLVTGANPDIHGGDGQSLGNNLLVAGTGNDVIYGDSGSKSGAGNNTLQAGAGNDTLYAGDIGDILQAGPGVDALYGGPGNDTIALGFYPSGQSQPPDTLDGGAGTNTLVISPLVLPTPTGSNYKIYLAQTSVAGQYQATLSSLDTGTVLGQNTFTMSNGISNLEIDGGPGDNWIQVDPGVTQNVVLYGGTGHNTLMAGSGSDTLYAGSGTSVLYGGSGNDLLYGGDDPAVDTPPTLDSSVTLAQDVIQVNGTITANSPTVSNLSSLNGLIVGQVVIGAGIVSGTTITSIDSTHNTITLSTNAIRSSNSSEALDFAPPTLDGPDTLIAGTGNDELFAGSGGDVLIGGSVLRQTQANGAPGLAQLTSGGQYILTLGAGRDYLSGGAGNDLLIAGPGSSGEVLVAGTGNDTLVAENGGNNLLQGGPGEDLLLGGSGNDVLESGSVGSGSNTLVGGLGIDTLQASGNDTISANTFNDVLYAYPNTASWVQAEQSAVKDNVILTQPGVSVPAATSLEQAIGQLLQNQQNQANGQGLSAADLQTLTSDLNQEFATLGVSSPILTGDKIANDLQPQTLTKLTLTDLQTLVSALDQAPIVHDELQSFLTSLQLTQTQGSTPAWHNLLHVLLVDQVQQLSTVQANLNSQFVALENTIGLNQPTPAQQAQLDFVQQQTFQVNNEINILEAEVNPQGGTVVESLIGGSGYDQLYGSLLFPTSMGGGKGSDIFYNYNTNDTVQGGGGGDNTLVIQGDGTINLQPDSQNPNGIDVTIGTQPPLLVGDVGNILGIQNLKVQTGNGNDTVQVGSGSTSTPFTLQGGLTGLIVQAGGGNDTINAVSLTNPATLLGGSGNDTTQVSALATGDSLNGGTGQSELDVVGPSDPSQNMAVTVANGALTVNVAGSSATASLNNFNKVVMIGGAGTNSFTSDGTTIQNANGSPTTVVMEGGSGTNTFTATNGTVEMVGGSGSNTFNADNGTVTMIGGPGGNTFNLYMHNAPASNGAPQAQYLVTGGDGEVNIIGDDVTNPGGTIILTQVQRIPNAPLTPLAASTNPTQLPIWITTDENNASGGPGTTAIVTTNLGWVNVNGGMGDTQVQAEGMLSNVNLQAVANPALGNPVVLVGGAGLSNEIYYDSSDPLNNYDGGSGLQPYYDGGRYGKTEEGGFDNTLVFQSNAPTTAIQGAQDFVYYGDLTGNQILLHDRTAPTVNIQQPAAPITAFSAQISDPDSNPNASISWGDGTTTGGNLTSNPDGTYTVSNSHIYAERGNHEIQMVYTDVLGDSGENLASFTGGLELESNGDLRYYTDSTNFQPVDTGVKSYLVRNADANEGPSSNPDVAVYTLHTDGTLYRIDSTGTQQQLSGDTFQTLLSDPYGGLFALDTSGNLYYDYPFGQWTLTDTGVQNIYADGNGTIYKWMANGSLYQVLPGAYVVNNGVAGPAWTQVELPNNASGIVTAVSVNTDNSTLNVRDGAGQYWGYNSSTVIDQTTSLVSPWNFLGGVHLALQLEVNGKPIDSTNPPVAGTPVSVTVFVLDHFYSPVASSTQTTVHFTSSDGVAGSPADVTFTGPSDTFNYTFVSAGPQSLSAYLENGSTVSPLGAGTASVAVSAAQASSATVQVAEATPANLQSPPASTPAFSARVEPLVSPDVSILNPPAAPANTAISGTPLTVTVTAYDAYGNVATGYNGTINFSSSGSSGLPSSYTFTSTDAGVHTFYATASTGGTQSVSVSDTIHNFSSTSAPVVVVNPATQLLVTLQPSVSVMAGQTFSLNVAAVDALGHLNPTFGRPITVALGNNSGGSTLGGTLTVNAVNGVATFSNLTLDKAGTGYTLKASSSGLTGTTTGAFEVTAAPATQLVVTTPPPDSVAVNNGFDLAISTEDANGNVDTSFNGFVTIALKNNPGGATLSDHLTVPVSNGVATFYGLSLNQAGNGYTLEATTTSSTGAALSVTTGSFNVAADAATQLVVTSQPPSTVGAGQGFGLVISAEDDKGNVDTSFNGAVTVLVDTNPGSANLGGTLTVKAVDGKATFSGLMLDQLGIGYTLAASSNGLTGTTTGSFDVAGSATQLVVTTPPAGTVGAGLGFGFVVSAEDAFGDINPSFNGTVTVALQNNPGHAALGGSLTIHAVNGVATFSDLTLNPVASGYTLQVSSNGLTAATTGAINVSGAATQLAITAQPPGSVGLNNPFTLVVSAVDTLGTVDPKFNGQVTIALKNNPSGAALGGTLTADAVNGVATFSGLTLNQPGVGYTLQVTAGGLTGTTTAPVTVFVPISPPPPPPPHSPPPPPPPPAPPQVPPLLALFNQFLGGLETVNANGTTITDSLFGFPMVETYDYFGNLVSVTILGFNITFLFG